MKVAYILEVLVVVFATADVLLTKRATELGAREVGLIWRHVPVSPSLRALLMTLAYTAGIVAVHLGAGRQAFAAWACAIPPLVYAIYQQVRALDSAGGLR